MNRRGFLGRLTVGAAGVVSVSGCLGSSESPPEERSNGTDDGGGLEATPDEWRHDVGGGIDAVAAGRVIGREFWRHDDADGGIFALDAETGEHRWTYGETGGFSGYTEVAVDDAAYVGLGDDAIGSGSGELVALEFDGEVRWTADTGSVYARPQVVDGVVYVGSDDGVVRALDAEDGGELWSVEPGDGETSQAVDVAAVTDVVYVEAGRLVALERDDGSVAWRYGEANGRVGLEAVADDVAYVADSDGVAAVVDGEAAWHVPFESNRWIRGLESDRVLVRHEWDLYALDAGDGEQRWVVEDLEQMRIATHDGRVYVGSDRLSALDAEDGREEWVTDVDDGEPVESVAVAADGEAEPTLFVHSGDARLARVDAGGTETWTETVDGSVYGGGEIRPEGGDHAFVGTTEAIYSLKPT
ncbi:PQQ-binding-like beta-propeller repeat protein [Natrononativus amylolyticus]|uniref:outer membrane protein assembly factor BamB family protein n=1 Tax=Natrononativus amylolyticus TaxID=2963434 RepID=UPI0020CBB256|nr:PQQ-binding-like beta-propeller repeat protein [Natrononativus amylolyticus]